MNRYSRREWGPWAIVAVLFLLCGVLAVLQNRWVEELSVAEGARFRHDLQESLGRFQQEFNAKIENAAEGLMPASGQIQSLGLREAFALKPAAWTGGQARFFRYAVLAILHGADVQLWDLMPQGKRNVPMAWPPEWDALRSELRARQPGELFGPLHSRDSSLLDIPLFGRERNGGIMGWVLLELDLDYLRDQIIPGLLAHTLDRSEKLQYQAEITSNQNSGNVIFRTGSGKRLPGGVADASVSLLNIAEPRSPTAPSWERGWVQREQARMLPGRWRLTVRYNPGALDSVLVRARWENAALSALLLGLILATGGVLVRYTRHAQKLAELQFNFVAGISHELRTPVTIIRTASYNLNGDLATRPDQVRRYGAMIHAQSKKLGDLLEQVLSFGSARAGSLVHVQEETCIQDLIEHCVSESGVGRFDDLIVERRYEPSLPPRVAVDRTAIQLALNNLVGNAIKYGTEEHKWIGIFASGGMEANGRYVEIRVADRGPGIPPREQKQVFEPFFRGERSLRDQVQGTGLGLSLTRYVVEAHGGSVTVKSEATGTEFVLKLPVRAPG